MRSPSHSRTYRALSLALALLINGAALPGLANAKRAPRTAAAPAAGKGSPDTNRPAESVAENFRRLPLRFEANRGQWDARVRFLARGLGYGLFLTGDEALMVFEGGKSKAGRAASTVRMRLVGANPRAEAAGAEQLPGRSDYFIGRDPAAWRTGVPAFARVLYRGVYPGTDLVYHGDQRQLEYDFRLAPGADPRLVRVAFEGARARLDRNGDLVLRTREGAEVRQHRPVAYQEVGGARREVAARFAPRGKNTFGFEVGAYDARLPLVIDPTVSLAYGARVGGAGVDAARDMVLNADGSVWLAGVTTSPDFPVTAGAPQSAQGDTPGFGDVFVAKLSPAGDAVLYASYLGGSQGDEGYGVATDAAGNVYVTGYTLSPEFPVTPGAFQSVGTGRQDAFVTKINPSAAGAAALVYSTLLGGSFADFGEDIAVDSAGRVHLIGDTNSASFPTRNAFDPTYNGINDGHLDDVFVAKLNPAGNGAADLLYSTFLGGSPQDFGLAVAVDGAGNTYATGSTASNNFPTTPGAFDTVRGDPTQGVGGDVFVTKLNTASAGPASLVYSTFVGGADSDSANDIKLDAAGNVYVAGGTFSPDFPTTPGAFQTVFHGAAISGAVRTDAFAAKLDLNRPGAAALLYSTYLGGADSSDGASAVAFGPTGDIYVAGGTSAPDFPVTCTGIHATFRGGPFITRIDPTKTGADALVYSSFWSSANGSDSVAAMEVDGAGNVYLGGSSFSADFPLTPGGYRNPSGANTTDAFVAKLDQVRRFNCGGDTTPPSLSCPGPVAVDAAPGSCSAVVTYTASATDNEPGVTVSYNPPSGSTFPLGTTTVTATAADAAGNSVSCSFDVTVRDGAAPAISCPPPITIAGNIAGSCGANVDVGAPTASDSCSDAYVSGTRADGLALDAPYPQGTTVITWTATDAGGNGVSCQQPVTVTNPSPAVTINSPESGAVYAVGAPVSFTGSYADNAGGTHTAQWTFGGSTQGGVVDEATGRVTATHTFTESGVYPVKLTVSDGCGGEGEATTVGEFDALVVVYDPADGFLTAGGWFNSPAGAYQADPSATGKANFGLVSKYLPGATVPTGETEFQLKAGNLNFHSTAYEWLVVAGARAQYRGSGQVNGEGNYGFVVTVIDGQAAGGGGADRFRLKIWNKLTGALVYDTQPFAPSTANPTTPLGGGQIVIHER